MVKKILFIQNRTGIKRSNFFDHWENIHAPHMVNVLKPQKYILTFFEEDIENGCCGMAELWFNSESEYQEAMERSCLLYTSPSPRDSCASRMPSSA